MHKIKISTQKIVDKEYSISETVVFYTIKYDAARKIYKKCEFKMNTLKKRPKKPLIKNHP